MNRPTILSLRRKCPYCVNMGQHGYVCKWCLRYEIDDKNGILSHLNNGLGNHKCNGCKFVYAITNINATKEERRELFMAERRYQRSLEERLDISMLYAD